MLKNTPSLSLFPLDSLNCSALIMVELKKASLHESKLRLITFPVHSLSILTSLEKKTHTQEVAVLISGANLAANVAPMLIQK